jgi:hypothetical protein
LATAECREPASSDRLPVHRSESPTGYSSAGCSSAEPASASPVTDNSSLIPILRLALMQCRAGRLCRQQGCHLYFARRVSFLSCADISAADAAPAQGCLPPQRATSKIDRRLYCFPSFLGKPIKFVRTGVLRRVVPQRLRGVTAVECCGQRGLQRNAHMANCSKHRTNLSHPRLASDGCSCAGTRQ